MSRKLALVMIPLMLSFAPVAWAQVQTGSILVKAVDQQGAVLPGATVTLTSPVMPGERTGVTDSNGVYRFVSLTIGTYQVKVSMQGFQPVIRPGVLVQQGQTANVPIELKIGTMEQAVTVTGESPVVDTKTTGSVVNIDSHLLQTTPNGKDIWSILEYKAPGVTIDGGNAPDVGGNQGGLQRSMSARGTPNSQNTQMLNGVNVNDPSAQGYSMNYYIPSAFQNVEVSSSAEDIAVGTGGVFINMVTKSGTNVFAGQGLQTYQSSRIASTDVDAAQQAAGLAPTGNVTNLLTNSNGQVGGPLVKNKLFYFGSVNFQATHISVLGFPAVPPPQVPTKLGSTSQQDTTDILAGEGKLTWAPNGSNHFEGYVSKQRYDKPNRGASAGNTQASDWKELDTFVIEQLSWNGVLSDRMFVDAKVSYNNTHFPLYQKTDLQSLYDNSTGIRYQNNSIQYKFLRQRLEALANWQYFLPDVLGGRHELKAGFDRGYTPATVDYSHVDGVALTFNSLPTAQASTVTLYSGPETKSAVTTTALYAQDAYTYKRLTLIGGIRWERVEGYLPAQNNQNNPITSPHFPAGTEFTNVRISGTTYPTYTVQDTFAAVHNDPLWKDIAPRVSVTYDLAGNGKTVLKFSLGKYLDQISTGTPPNPNGTVSQSYNWNDTNGNLVFDPGSLVWNPATNTYTGGELGSLRSTSIPNPNGFFDKSLKRPSRNELSVGVDHELFPNMLVSASFYHTREHNTQGTVDANFADWPTLYTLTTLTDPGPDGVAGTTDDQPIQVYNLNPGAVTSTSTVNDDRLATHYNGVEFIVHKRYSNGWTVLGSYDYSHTSQDVLSLSNPNNAYVNATGESGGRRHIFKFSGSYTLPHQILVAANLRLQSGLPITRTWAISACSATVTSNCLNQAVTVNAIPRGSVELAWLPTLDLRVGRTFRLGTNRFDLSLDVFNVTNANTVWGVRTNTGLTYVRAAADPNAPVTTIASWLSPTGVQSPRVAQINFTYTFGGR
jgi:Carboxypeptidase regulatory-like domain/TonB-dependent Receptor Plug Domain